ncbi:hypothetical protein SAMD00019534_124650 [Acytostelium subglobosum LB1]|uniref:hypothetical protein n=1 Tax=Acytostelium subglobosum LB1 TaxID=1410327 RepID=UPI000644F2A1|nr:hypothetical protein SAMD00019534_124650 [Acytostelium subglobosum LB1]GAM29289.1 hypothetical protein SAMD00019534_124650 [Acytostelium subglobosum LB1]|eukprot:XP_012747787.1 hypothetical protein SAMD00019534_124650 [Acytostelium subglobosum LB1]
MAVDRRPTKSMAPDQAASSMTSSSSNQTTPKQQFQSGPKVWGRNKDVGTGTVIGSFLMMLCTPLLVIYFYIACNSYQCSLSAPLFEWFNNDLSLTHLIDWTIRELPVFSMHAAKIYIIWLLFQAVLYTFLPATIGYGQQTPAGYTLPYKVNGLLAWVVSHVLYFVGGYLGLWSLAIAHDNWGGLLVIANLYGYFLTFFSYFKALVFPSHPEDRKFSGSIIYDIVLGVEFNPRFGKYFDFKLFHNGRPGIVAWTLIDMSFAAAQYQQVGYITNSMILLNILHATYVLDFFYNEDWYLRTIDIAHDHFGFMLAWGDSVWLPFMYTLQSHYLVRNPIDLSMPYFLAVLVIGLSGYVIFRSVNHQKDIVRRTNGKCQIWGKPAKVIRTEFLCSDGKTHHSLLLCSGFWGLSRHFNYVGDLLISSAMCLTCGFGHLLPYFYIIFMTILLLHRIERDHSRCRGKYGKYWEMYEKEVPWKLCPYIY